MKKMLVFVCLTVSISLYGQTVIISENFDSLTAGNYVSLESPYFTTWSNLPGTTEDAFISDSISSSPTNSVHVEGVSPGGPTDILIPFPTNYTSGSLEFSMKYYVEPGKGAYFNLQQDTTPAIGWMLEVYFNSNGMGEIYGGSTSPVIFSYNPGTWTEILINVNLDLDAAKISIGGVLVHSYQFSTGSNGSGFVKSWGGVNLYAAGGTQSSPINSGYFADDILLQIPSNCPNPIASYMTMTNGLDVNFINLSGVFSNAQYLWDFDDGTSSTDSDPTHTFLTAGTYNVCLTVMDSCGMDSTCQNITVTDSSACPNPTADFQALVNGYVLSCFDSSLVTGSPVYSWSFGDGSTSSTQNPTYSYADTGSYWVCLTILDSCGMDSLCQFIAITDSSVCPAPAAAFSYTTNGLGVSFLNSSSTNGSVSNNWSFGDVTGFSTQSNPSYTYALDGSYLVCLTIVDSCGTDSICQMITVADSSGCPMPVAGFSYSTSGLDVTFASSSTYTGGVTYSWVFGDGGTSNLQSPVNSYSTDGAYMVCLTIVDSCGTDSVCQTIAVADSSVGIYNSNLETGPVLYPNPANDKLYLTGPNLEGCVMAIYDGLGRLVIETIAITDNQYIDLTSCEEGIYFYQVMSENYNHLYSGKLMILR